MARLAAYDKYKSNTEFDVATASKPYTYTEGNPNVVIGFQEGVFGMKVGGTRRIIVPPSVGYGSEGKGNVVPPNSVLVFDVTLEALK